MIVGSGLFQKNTGRVQFLTNEKLAPFLTSEDMELSQKKLRLVQCRMNKEKEPLTKH